MSNPCSPRALSTRGSWREAIMARRSSSGSRPRYWHPRNPLDREELRQEIARCLESDGPPEVAQPLPPVDPFGEWWDSLPDAKRRELGLLAEDYETAEDFLFRYLAKNVDLGPSGETAQEWITRNLQGLFADAKRMQADQSYARTRIARFLHITKRYLNLAFGIREVAHRRAANVERDREWSKRNYQGRTYAELADAYSRKTGKDMDETAIRTAVDRHRKRRAGLTRLVALTMWEPPESNNT
jgi:hypothetical protein